jgi:hypothetical protein
MTNSIEFRLFTRSSILDFVLIWPFENPIEALSIEIPSLKSPSTNPPLQRGAGGIFGRSFQRGKVAFFKELNCYGFLNLDIASDFVL